MSPNIFVLAIPSEIANVINFLFVDILLLSYIMYMSGLFAGHANHFTLQKQGRLDLVPCDIPLVGGGIVMPRGRQRRLLLALRLSVVLAVFTCNFGLEGRSQPRMSTRSALVRKPGPLTNPDCSFYCASERRRRCLRKPESNATDAPFLFAAVIDNLCYPELTDHVYIKEMAFNHENVTASTTNCKSEPNCAHAFTKFRCDNADLSCHGVDNSTLRCGRSLPELQPETCHAVVYASDEKSAWLCQIGELVPEQQDKLATCRRVEAKRKDMKWWLDNFRVLTLDPMQALFASAYGIGENSPVNVPDGEEAVTIVNLFWVLPVAWVLFAVVALTIGRRVLVLKKAQVVVHDEGGLTKLLNRRIERWERGELD